MNLTTTYMGFELAHPLIPGASPMVDNLDTVRRLEDSGAPMMVMHSLFEEQIVNEEVSITRGIEMSEETNAEALSYLPRPVSFVLGPDEYLEHIGRIKRAVSVPVIASLNGTTEGGWLHYAGLIEQAGADGLELNLYDVSASLEETGDEVENRQLNIVRKVKGTVGIPVAVKLSPFYCSMATFARQVDLAGADALILFNRFYEPDIDLEQLDLLPINVLSSPAELRLRLRWIGMLSGRIHASLAVTGGVHSAVEAVKAVMAGAHAVQMVSALLMYGPTYLKTVLEDLERWLEEHEYVSLGQMRGSMDLLRTGSPEAYERANYIKQLQSWHSE